MARGKGGGSAKKVEKVEKVKTKKEVVFPGKTVNGYSPAKAAARAAKRS